MIKLGSISIHCTQVNLPFFLSPDIHERFIGLKYVFICEIVTFSVSMTIAELSGIYRAIEIIRSGN